MTIDQRTCATEIAEGWHAEEDRAITIHRAGQLTIADYHRLDKVDPHEITGTYRVRTRPSWEVHEYLGHTAAGWLVRAEFEAARWEHTVLAQKWAEYQALPYLRLVDELTGFSFPDPKAERVCTPARRAKVMDVPPLDTSHAPESERTKDQDEEAETPPT